VTMKKRNFDVGFEDKAISPFRIPGIYSEVPEQVCELPSLDSLETYGFKMHLQMTPIESQKKQILKIAYPDKKGVVLEPAIHFPAIIAHIRQEAIREVGQDVDRPTFKNSVSPTIALSKAH